MPLSILCDARDVADALGLDFPHALALVLEMDRKETFVTIIAGE